MYNLKSIISFLLVFCVLLSCQKQVTDQAELASRLDAQIIVEWTDLINELISETKGYTIPASARAMVYISIGVYESSLPGMPVHKSLKNQLPGFAHNAHFEPALNYDIRITINKVYSSLCLHFFETAPFDKLQKITHLEQKWHSKLVTESQHPANINRSINAGIEIASAIKEYEATDAIGNKAYLKNNSDTYTIPNVSGSWTPIAPHYKQAIFPEWGEAKLLGVKNNTLQANLPPQFSTESTSEYYQAAISIHERAQNLSLEQMHIAEFWDDYAPESTMGSAARWIAILAQVIHQEQLSLETAVESLTKGALSIYNSTIVCWKEKYRFTLQRPVSFIKANIDDSFTEYMFSQPSPEYISEHSIIAAAAAHVFESVIGSVTFTDRCHENRMDFNGTPRTFRSFSQAAEECSMSRFYAGTNFMFSIEEGKRLGKLTANQVMNNISWKY